MITAGLAHDVSRNILYLFFGLQSVPPDHLLTHSIINIDFSILTVSSDEGPCQVLAYLEKSVGFLLQLAPYLLENIVFKLDKIISDHVIIVGLGLLVNHPIDSICTL